MTKLNIDRSRYGIFNSPSSRQSRTKRADINSGANTPIFQAQGLLFVCQHHIVSLISVLLVRSSPSAITNFVIATLVRISINTVPDRWSFTHIFQKRLKRISPPFADLNAIRAIPLVVLIVAVVASSQHRSPRTVCRRRGFAMRGWAFLVQRVSKAATACASLAAKASTGYRSQSAAVASTVPHSAALLIQPCIVDNSPSTKDSTRQILHTSGWNRDRIGISHVSVPLPERNVVRAAPQFKLRCRSLLLQKQLAA